jgi:chitodextrinase
MAFVAGCSDGGSPGADGVDDGGGDDSSQGTLDAGRDVTPDARSAVDSGPTEAGGDARGGDATADDGPPGDGAFALDGADGDDATAPADGGDDALPVDASDGGAPVDASEGGPPVDASDASDSAAPSDADADADAVDTTPPSVPTGLVSKVANTSSIALGWTASTDPDSPVAGYNVYRNGVKIGTATVTNYVDSGLASGTFYRYTVSAFDPGGNTSAQSDPVNVTTLDTTAPTVPTGLTETAATTTSISLSWTASTDPDSPVAGYHVYRGGIDIGMSASASYTDNGLLPSTGYLYRVTAYDPTGNTSALSVGLIANTSTPVDTTPPSVPTGLAATGATTTSISLAWTASTDPDSPVAGYNVYRGGTKIGTSTTTSYNDSGLTANTTYSYTVSAFDPTANTSAQSAPLTTATNPPVDTTPPTVPMGLTKTGATASSITLGWTASTDPDSPVAGYNVYRGTMKVGTSTTTSYTDTGLSVDTTYSYTVSAYDATGNTSAPSSPFGAATSNCSILVSTNTYTMYDGFLTYQNKGTGAETNPSVHFTLPAGATLDPKGCAFSNQSAPGCTAVMCSQSGTTVTYAFTGSLAAGALIQMYYSTNVSGEPVATNIFVTAGACP